MDVELTSAQCSQGGLEIKYKVTVKVPSVAPTQVTARYRALA